MRVTVRARGAAEKRGVQQAGEPDVVDEAPGAAQERDVLDAQHVPAYLIRHSSALQYGGGSGPERSPTRVAEGES